ncbi:MAG: DUF3667 domain-containing protein [Saprospiraceae bacterium]|nr:DUF3667 domain-containing protein [Saprospiraceae bacterium]
MTIKTMFAHPGKITNDFIEDKRNRYSPPVRMFIWCTAFYMFSFWLLMDTFSHYSEPASEANKSLSQRFDELHDTTSTPIGMITNGFWPTLPMTPVSRQRLIKNMPDSEIKSWLQDQKYPTDYFHIQLVKAYRTQINSQLTLSAYTKNMTTGNNIIFVLLLPLNALLLFPILYRKNVLL